MNNEAIDRLIDKNPKLEVARTLLERMQPGTYCIHRSWGFGQIQSYNEEENRLIIDFEDDKKAHPMAPEFCIDKLEILKDTSVLVRKRTDSELIDRLIKKEPNELIVEILKDQPNQEALSREIEKILSYLLGVTKYKKWWTSAKKSLVKDPRIAVPSRTNEPYVLREDPITPEEEILEEFFETKKPKSKIELAEKLLILSNEAQELKDKLPEVLDELTAAINATRQLTYAERLQGVWVRNDLARDIHEDVETLVPTSASIIEAAGDLANLADDLPSQYYKRFLDLLSRVYPDNWTDVILKLLQASSGKLTSECMNFLVERGATKALSANLEIGLTEQTLKAPVLVWILKNRTSKKYGNLLDQLIGPRLLSAIFYAIDYEALQNAGTRRIPLADLLSDDTDLIADLLATADSETARDLAQTLLLNQGFENLTKKSLLARFINQFPNIQSLVEGDEAKKSSDEGLLVSVESYDERTKELEDIIHIKIPENKQAIATARDHGDLKENSEYKMAKEDQATLLARRSQLEMDLGKARITDFKDANTETVGVGNYVEILDKKDGSVKIFAILGAWDSVPEKNILSYKTPLAQTMLGKKSGDEIVMKLGGNETHMVIQKITRWVDSKS
jgi:transcription elongation GreA/GreB family factor